MDLADLQNFSTRLALRYVDDDEPGIQRIRRGRGFSFHDSDGTLLSGADRDRCVALVIPPAWEQVWICRTGDGHLQARGTDAAERRQYRYHDRWTQGRSSANFDRLADIGPRLAGIRRELDGLLVDPTDPVRRALAAMVRLVDAGTARIGGTRSVREHGHYGVSTLRVDHVRVDGDHIRLAYPGKSGVERDLELQDPVLADVLAQVLAELDADSGELFAVHHEGRHHRLTAADANDLLAGLSARQITCKDFRTWGGSAVALQARVQGHDEVAAVDAAADALGNTRAVARGSYIHPDVLEAPLEELQQAWATSRSSRRYDRRERALIKFLDSRPSLLERLGNK